MFKFGKVILLCLSTLVFMPAFAEQESIRTALGVVDVSRSSPESSPDTLGVNGKAVYVEEGMYINLYEKFSLAGAEVLLFGVNCGGTGCPNDDLHFLILQEQKKPDVVSADGFYSLDGTVKPRLDNGELIVDLGYEDGKSKTAELNAGSVLISLAPQPVAPMRFEDCKWLHEYSMSECINAKSFDSNCEAAEENFSGVTSRGVAALSNHPGFAAKPFHSACVTACQTGTAVAFDRYKSAVCSIK